MKPVVIERCLLTLQSPKRDKAWVERIGGYRSFSIGRARGEVPQKPVKLNKNSTDVEAYTYTVNS